MCTLRMHTSSEHTKTNVGGRSVARPKSCVPQSLFVALLRHAPMAQWMITPLRITGLSSHAL